MLHIFTGTRSKVIKESEALLKKLFKESPDLGYEKFDGEDPEEEILKIRDLSEAQSLFGNKTVVVVDEVEESAEALAEVRGALEASQNIFIIRQSERELVGRPEFNIFSFTDAVGARNKRMAWILYQKALISGLAAEEVFYKLVWQVKTLILAAKSKTAEEAGMKAYPYTKAKGNLRNWQVGELEDLSLALVHGYHDARRGKGEVETFVEKILLNI